MKKFDEDQMYSIVLGKIDKHKIDEFVNKFGTDSVDRDGRTILSTAVVENNKNLVKYLISKGFDVNASDSDGLTALHLAAIHNRYKMIEILLENGAKVNSLDKWGNTPISRAVYPSQKLEKFNKSARILLANGGDLSIKNFYGISMQDLMDKYSRGN
ncbi:ankyrin repeat domain-containing protein [Taylorella equigenitalis]|uniref:ankyrin repeat domain-containing protein n=1 Tax=Taylorella equigenitalis TaxID=29575 RepID=UPI000401C6B2|nr:ankyrin repeat domain-containing protein [Taylorella equigenitalis]ASY30695.1 hypothetical protein B9Z30_04845 [Taylorella equigenitalis]KOS58306.1 ankyrin [Taylorella equigenitalis]WDU54329.1 ankyrin repeat domain-containing protein [Taylorella equigenitalis]